MRAIGTMVLLGLVAARPASAEPPETAKTQKSDKKDAKAGEAGSENAAPAASMTALGLGSMAALAARAVAESPEEGSTEGQVETGRLDLTPRGQLESERLARPSAGGRGSERAPGVTLGDDTSWKVQAAQVGAMAAIFTTLVAVCGNGRCLLPESFGGGKHELGPPPGVLAPAQPRLRDPR